MLVLLIQNIIALTYSNQRDCNILKLTEMFFSTFGLVVNAAIINKVYLHIAARGWINSKE
jgi:hypothetical protein